MNFSFDTIIHSVIRDLQKSFEQEGKKPPFDLSNTIVINGTLFSMCSEYKQQKIMDILNAYTDSIGEESHVFGLTILPFSQEVWDSLESELKNHDKDYIIGYHMDCSMVEGYLY